MRNLAPILLNACRVAGASRPERDADPEQQPDWSRLLDAARYHAVTPLVARWLAGAPDGVPPEVLAALHEHHDANALRNIVLTRTLYDLHEQLTSRGIAVMPIKGPTLAISAYGDLALREFGDLDVIVPPSSFARARALLTDWGYRPLTPLSSAGELALRSSDHHVPLVHEVTGVAVELHWSLDNLRPGRILDAAWVWSNMRTVPLLGRELPSLSWSALLVYLCVHGAKHGFERLGWIRDIAGVLEAAPPGELAMALELAADSGTRRRLGLGVRLASELLGARPRDDLQLGDSRQAALLERDVHTRFFSGARQGLLEQIVFQCRTFDRARDGAGYVWYILAAPHVADVEALSLPRRLHWTYHVLRPVRLVARALRTLAGGSTARGRAPGHRPFDHDMERSEE